LGGGSFADWALKTLTAENAEKDAEDAEKGNGISERTGGTIAAI
jgi:hypothetical protein